MSRNAARLGVAMFCFMGGLGTRAGAVTSVICISAKGNGPMKFRAAPKTCSKAEVQIGSFDGTTFQFSGVNVQVVSGSGATDAAVNGLGNLIVGYNENDGANIRSGSHNLVVGNEHTYTSYGGLVAGKHNNVTAPGASVTAGYNNTASAPYAAVSGGGDNTASGGFASVSGGDKNVANTTNASVSGGMCNLAGSGAAPTCPLPLPDRVSVSGGFHNVASGNLSSVGGGENNAASGDFSSVSGGAAVSASATDTWHTGQTAGFPTGSEY